MWEGKEHLNQVEGAFHCAQWIRRLARHLICNSACSIPWSGWRTNGVCVCVCVCVLSAPCWLTVSLATKRAHFTPPSISPLHAQHSAQQCAIKVPMEMSWIRDAFWERILILQVQVAKDSVMDRRRVCQNYEKLGQNLNVSILPKSCRNPFLWTRVLTVGYSKTTQQKSGMVKFVTGISFFKKKWIYIQLHWIILK